MSNEMIGALSVLEAVDAEPRGLSAADLARGLGVSRASVHRYVAKARFLGADLVAVRQGPAYVFQLRNGATVRSRLRKLCAMVEKLQGAEGTSGVLTGSDQADLFSGVRV